MQGSSSGTNSKLLASDVDIRFVDLPVIEGATGKFLLHQMASVAELEAGVIFRSNEEGACCCEGTGRKAWWFSRSSRNARRLCTSPHGPRVKSPSSCDVISTNPCPT